MRVLVLFEGFYSVDDDIANATSHIKSKETWGLCPEHNEHNQHNDL